MNEALISERDREELALIEGLLTSTSRVNVIHSYSLHNMAPVEGGIRFHLVLKFKYDDKHIESVFGAKKPKAAIEKRYGEAHRIFPYCIFNAIDEVPISWTYQNSGGRVYERIEMYATVTNVNYMRYFPFVFKVLNLKVGSDGTAKTGLVNLLPELKADGMTPNVDFGIFTKETSEFHIQPDGIEKGDVVCRMVVRDLSGDSLGNLSGIYTRVYTVFFFESEWAEDLLKYLLTSMLLVYMTVFLPFLKIQDLLATSLALILTEVALLFVMPPTMRFTTAETTIVIHMMYMFLLTFVIGLPLTCGVVVQPLRASMVLFALNAIMTAVTAAWMVREWLAFNELKARVRQKFRSMHKFVGTFKEIDEQI